MPTILCFGDSNTWGTVPEENRRYRTNERWPTLLRDSLPENYNIIEDGKLGRTTVHDDPFEIECNGLRDLRPSLKLHCPDLVLLMLGTNDLKRNFDLTAHEISEGASILVKEVLNFKYAGKQCSPRVLLMSPPPIYEVGLFAKMFAGGEAKSLSLAKYYAQQAKKQRCSFINTGAIIMSSKIEGIHWELE